MKTWTAHAALSPMTHLCFGFETPKILKSLGVSRFFLGVYSSNFLTAVAMTTLTALWFCVYHCWASAHLVMNHCCVSGPSGTMDNAVWLWSVVMWRLKARMRQANDQLRGYRLWAPVVLVILMSALPSEKSLYNPFQLQCHFHFLIIKKNRWAGIKKCK